MRSLPVVSCNSWQASKKECFPPCQRMPCALIWLVKYVLRSVPMRKTQRLKRNTYYEYFNFFFKNPLIHHSLIGFRKTCIQKKYSQFWLHTLNVCLTSILFLTSKTYYILFYFRLNFNKHFKSDTCRLFTAFSKK